MDILPWVPSRVNPLTGQILNAEILVDASFIRALKKGYRQNIDPLQSSNTLSALMDNQLLCNHGLEPKNKPDSQSTKPENKTNLGNLSLLASRYDLCYGMESAKQFEYGSLVISMLQNTMPNQDKLNDYVHQYLRLIIAHEVGHTLGLRHNFRGSNLLAPEEMNNQKITQSKGLSSSVMDYLPANIAPPGIKQGDYFPMMVGLYDDWAIQYGYTPTNAKTPVAEKSFLAEIAKQSYQPELSYATDEDINRFDPTINVWDHSNNSLIYAQGQLDNSLLLWERLNKIYPASGDSYSEIRQNFGVVLNNYSNQIYYVNKYIGGQVFYREPCW